jgi:hypothetical protein
VVFFLLHYLSSLLSRAVSHPSVLSAAAVRTDSAADVSMWKEIEIHGGESNRGLLHCESSYHHRRHSWSMISIDGSTIDGWRYRRDSGFRRRHCRTTQVHCTTTNTVPSLSSMYPAGRIQQTQAIASQTLPQHIRDGSVAVTGHGSAATACSNSFHIIHIQRIRITMPHAKARGLQDHASNETGQFDAAASRLRYGVR